MGVTFWTFGVEHHELKKKYGTIQKKEKVPNFIINKTCRKGYFSWDMRRQTEIQ